MAISRDLKTSGARAGNGAARFYGKIPEILPIPNLVDLQTRSYQAFLQADLPFTERKAVGLEAIIREVFPIVSYDKSMVLEYIGYELGRPRYSPEECKMLRLTYGAPFKIRVRLEKPEPVEEEVYLGEIPIMIGGGEFIVNGAERVIVSQLHRSPGVDFSVEVGTGEKKVHSCWIIPERGSWVELTVGKKDSLHVRIDQSGKFPATSLLRALSEEHSTDEDIIRLFHATEKLKTRGRTFTKTVEGRFAVGDIVDLKTGEVLVACGEPISAEQAGLIAATDLKEVEVLKGGPREDALVLNTVREDPWKNHQEALLKIYARLRPGNPPQLEKARDLLHEKFFDPTRYRLGRVGRFRLNRKFGQAIPETEMTLHPDDYINSIRYILKLRRGEGEIDDIDHLGNRRVRTIAELAGDEFRKGFLKLRRTVQERMNIENLQTVTPRSLINSKTISSAVDYFFGRGELSQVVDQINPLAQLTHERRLSALGPGGLNRKRAGFEVRDVHISHYGRICPIETPEGTNIGLIASLSIFADTDAYGFLTTPYRVVKNARVTDEIVLLRADEEYETVLAPADTPVDDKGRLVGEADGRVLARVKGDFRYVEAREVAYIDVSPKQLVGVSASLIPFLEHDDANRALMGSNMQRQAVPLLRTEAPIVATGMEEEVARNSGMVVTASEAGTVTRADASEIVIGERRYKLQKFVGLNERTCLNQKPIVRVGDKVKKGQVIADGAATREGKLALGRNVLVAFMTWEGYNFEDAVLISERLVKEDSHTSIHIDSFEIEIRETKLGREEFTREIPNVSERALRHLDDSGIVAIGTKVAPGDILVGKVAPKSKSELTPEEKLLHAIFGRAGEDVKNDSLEVPPGVEGIVIDAQKFSRKVNLTEEERQTNLGHIKEAEKAFLASFRRQLEALIAEIHEIVGKKLKDADRKVLAVDEEMGYRTLKLLAETAKSHPEVYKLAGKVKDRALRRIKTVLDQIEEEECEKNKVVNRLSRGDELPTGVLEMVKVYIATKRVLSVGDKVAGRHGNKGVVAKILPEEDMPFLVDGTPVDMVLNPLGVPSRMNVGQILETHLGRAARSLGFEAVTPVFDGCKEAEIEQVLAEAGHDRDGKVTLYDGRTGEPFFERVTVGYLYMMKLHHLVDDKIHARATGPYSLITQQPLGGKARFGGQRFGEMEVWALEAYGAANILQELLTVKSDDVDGRTKIYESMVKGENVLEPGTPVSFDVLTNEIRGLALNMELHKRKTAATSPLG
ncbi:MAG: DNA-directed RNA polymerase subunit beta [Planctomycetes bacterium]|nr:DNA-directed RNA polymerase subunit beta [Planctomycetota bacterium]